MKYKKIEIKLEIEILQKIEYEKKVKNIKIKI